MKNLLIVVLAFFVSSAYAQDYTFKVLIAKGQNTVKSGDGWLPIKVGTSLKETDELRVAEDGYLGLVHKEGKPLEVKQSGPYKVTDLLSRVKVNTSVLHKYTDFLLSSTEDAGTNLVATGAVVRGDERIRLYLPESNKAVVLNDEVVVSWTRQPNVTGYTVLFKSLFGDELSRFETQDTTLTVDLSGPKFAKEDNILVKVEAKNDGQIKSEDKYIKRLSKADKERIRTELKELKDLIAEKTAMNQFMLATFYEQNMLLIDAATAYQKAIKLAPDVADFQTAFNQFVLRQGLMPKKP